jgi:YVTN family beta-propeller protein
MRKTFLITLIVSTTALAAWQAGIFTTLKSTATLGKQSDGIYLLPTNQLLRPRAGQTLIAGRPVDLALSSDRRLLAVLNWRGVLLYDAFTVKPLGEIKSTSTSYTGLAFLPGDGKLWASEATRNGPDSILIAELAPNGTPGKVERLALPGHPVPAGIAFSKDGSTAYVAFSRNNSVAIVDVASRRVRREISVGIAPFAVVVSSQQERLFVSNRGGRRPAAGDTQAPSSGSLVVTNAITGSTATGSVSVIDLKDFSVKEIFVGLAPSGMALSPDENILAVANSHSDSVSLLDTRSLARKDVSIPAWPEGTLGSQPVGAAFAPDGSTLYIACGGNNAVAVVKASSKQWKVAGAVPAVAGALPAGWFPSAIAIDSEGALRVVNIKGVGNTADTRGTFNSRQYEGSMVKIPAPTPAEIEAGTREVQAANSPRFEPAGGVTNLSSLGIRYVFLIIKENRTYDQVFGDISQGNGDAKLVMFGRDVTPNHHALVERYVLLDNFYASGAISFDGHHWLMQAFVSDYVERAFGASPRGYAWNMTDALTIAPTGFFWQSARRPLGVRIYGEFSLPARWDPVTSAAVDIDESQLQSWSYFWRLYKEGKWQDAAHSRSGVPALDKYISTRYPVGLNVTDQIRVEVFLRDLAELEKNGDIPNLTVMTLVSDHTMGTKPDAPTPRAMVADNDLALGRVVEAISRSRFWPNSLILVVEDDAQNGVDHIDGHRTVALAIGPHVRRKVVDSNNYNHTSMIRTIQEIFEIPARTSFLKNARAMNSIFTPDADVTPYRHLTSAVPLDEMNPPLKALTGRKLWAARRSLAMNWRDVDDVPFEVLNRILWWDRKGETTPYPKTPEMHR